MKPTWTALFVDDTAWSLGLSDGQSASISRLPFKEPSHASPQKTQEILNAHIAQAISLTHAAGAKLGPLVIGLPSAWCLAATVCADGLARRQRRQGLIYRLEERLPVDAEHFTADFIPHPPAPENPENTAGNSTTLKTSQGVWSNQTLGVAVLQDRIKPLLDALDAAGLTVAHLCPTALLMHDAWATEQEAEPNDAETPQCLLIQSGIAEDSKTTGLDIVTSFRGRCVAWRSVPDISDAKNLHAEVQTASMPTEAVTKFVPWGIDAMPWDDLDLPPLNNAGLPHAAEALEQTTAFTHQLLHEGKPLVPDLRRDALAGRGVWQRVAGPATAAMLAFVLLMVSVGSLNLWRSHQLTAATTAQHDAQASLFRETFPGQRVPTAIMARFRSEAGKARGLTGNDDALPPPATTLADICDILAGLPEDLRFRVLELRVESNRFYLDGQARSHTDADRVAAGLRQTLGYTLEPPRTQNLSERRGSPNTTPSSNANSKDSSGGGGVGFTLVGHREGQKP